MPNKQTARKDTKHRVHQSDGFAVWFGKLVPPPGRPNRVPSLFKVVGEKLPVASLKEVQADIVEQQLPTTGVYVAHDSMGAPRYSGRGDIFGRLKSHFTKHRRELAYFSFYVVEDKKHEREIETLVIRAAGSLLHFNNKKKRVDIAPGNIRDFEAGTHFYERQMKKGKKKKKK